MIMLIVSFLELTASIIWCAMMVATIFSCGAVIWHMFLALVGSSLVLRARLAERRWERVAVPLVGKVFDPGRSRSELVQDLYYCRQELQACRTATKILEKELGQLRAEIAAKHTKQPDPDYEAVGLARGCPDVLVVASRRILRLHFHPDRYPPSERARMTGEFQLMERSFDAIYIERGLR